MGGGVTATGGVATATGGVVVSFNVGVGETLVGVGETLTSAVDRGAGAALAVVSALGVDDGGTSRGTGA